MSREPQPETYFGVQTRLVHHGIDSGLFLFVKLTYLYTDNPLLSINQMITVKHFMLISISSLAMACTPKEPVKYLALALEAL